MNTNLTIRLRELTVTPDDFIHHCLDRMSFVETKSGEKPFIKL